ncbi:sugar-binding transcriptional regulator [Paenalkalicoccus suaedae]|uniref:Sugar-binding transcriptional regulator n=1 Tax=Paenalkalicoccus suaedae TaxID=2592382 RepID=A0A859FAU4_9BACI|nr:sugar-binding transcriptional regulator [Paenalkalicoccus suaedae]QKS70463.1 sugar-binding transcriptional regulator [Paenalkalicoccus suaedae]
MTKDKLSRVVKVAKMYYQLDYSQQTIAKELGISRPSVSRLLHAAKEKGIVKITIVDPDEGVAELADVIKARFGLKECIIADAPVNENQVIKEELGRKAAEYLHGIVKDGDIIGTTWGTTLYEVARHMQPKSIHNVTVTQLNGGVSYSETNTYAAEILHFLGNAFHTSPYFLPLPAVVDHLVVKQAIVSDRHIRHVLELGKKATIALLTVGERHEDSALVKANYYTEEDKHVLKSRQAVGDICSRMITIDGDICDADINDRTIGIELESLRDIDHSILVVGGLTKVEGILGALHGGYANVLIIDQYAAQALADMGAN